MKRILIFGRSGQVGGALAGLLGDRGVALSHAEADFLRPESLPPLLDRHRPSAVINAAAYTQVDKAETEREAATRVNAEAPGVIARWCAAAQVPLVHYSTDYVFDGSGTAPWKEDDAPQPQGHYGASKRAGEEAVLAAGGACLVLRTSWVYDTGGRNFFNTMLRLGHEREELRVVRDQIGAPTYAPPLAEATLAVLEKACALPQFPTGIYHLCHGGETSWHGFAEQIFSLARPHDGALTVRRVQPIATTEYPTPARRPANSRLDCGKIRRMLNVALPSWQEGLAACIDMKYGRH